MDFINSVWISGTPRTGSMWTTNVTREILKYVGDSVFPVKQLQNDEDFFKLFQLSALNDAHRKNKYVLKTHQLMKLDLPRSKYIVNIRNPYDICASFFEFMQCDIKTAINVAKEHVRVVEYYKSARRNDVFFVRYEHMESSPMDVILDVSKFLRVVINRNDAEEISKKFDKNSVQRIIEDTDLQLNMKIKNKEKLSPDEVVIISTENYRAIDQDTGFQTGHISNRKSGEWSKSFVDSEIPEIVKALNDTAIHLGYQSELNKL